MFSILSRFQVIRTLEIITVLTCSISSVYAAKPDVKQSTPGIVPFPSASYKE